ncbi:MAG: SEC-C domain-containing protein [Cyclobacteriaceae bacterium]
MKKVGRNDPCPCGSGKKYKDCHLSNEKTKELSNKSLFYIALLIALLAIAGYGVYTSQESSRPDGPAPAGKVWSEEHGHYH